MKRIYMNGYVVKFQVVVDHDPIFIFGNPFRQITQFSNIPLLDNEFMNVGWRNYVFPGNRFINRRMDIRINEL